MAGLGGRDGGLEGDAVAHFTDEDDVGILTQHGGDPEFEVGHVEADFALLEHGFDVVEGVFDRVFERDDVAVLVVVDPVEHGRERGAFAAAGGAANNDDAVLGSADLEDRFRREFEFFERGNAVFNVTEHHAHQTALAEGVDAKPANPSTT